MCNMIIRYSTNKLFDTLVIMKGENILLKNSVKLFFNFHTKFCKVRHTHSVEEQEILVHWQKFRESNGCFTKELI